MCSLAGLAAAYLLRSLAGKGSLIPTSDQRPPAHELDSPNQQECSAPDGASNITGLGCIQVTLDRIQTLRETNEKDTATMETFCLEVSGCPDGSRCMILKTSGRLVQLKGRDIRWGCNEEIFLALLHAVNIEPPLPGTHNQGLELAADILRHLPTSKEWCSISNSVPCKITIPIFKSEVVAADFLPTLRGLLKVILERQFNQWDMEKAELNVIRMEVVQNADERTTSADLEVKFYGIRGFQLSLRIVDADEQEDYEAICAIILKAQQCLDATRKKDILERLSVCSDPLVRKIFGLVLQEEAVFARYRTATGFRPHLNIDELGLFSDDPESGHKYDTSLFQVSKNWRKSAAATFREHIKLILHEDLHNWRWGGNIRAIDRSLGGNLIWRQGTITCRLKLAPRIRRDNYEEYCWYDEVTEKVVLGNISETALKGIKQLLAIRVWNSHHRLVLQTPKPLIEETATASHGDFDACKMTLTFAFTSNTDEVSTLRTILEIELFPPRLRSGRLPKDAEKAMEQYKLAVHIFVEEQVGHQFAHSRTLVYRSSLNEPGAHCKECSSIGSRRRGVDEMDDKDLERLVHPRTYPV